MTYSTTYYEANKERVLAQNKEWRDANPEKVKESQRLWRAANEGRTYQDTSGYINYIGYEHPATNQSGVTRHHRIILWDMLNGEDADCNWCGRQLYWSKSYPDFEDALVVDHLNAIKNDNRPENLVPSCGSCNVKRVERTHVKTQIGECDFDGCSREKTSRGLCISHYNQQWSGKELQFIAVAPKLTKDEINEVVSAVYSGETITSIANRMGFEKSSIARTFKRVTGVSVRAFKAAKKAAA